MHSATLEEVIQRFGHGSEQREAQGQSLQWLVPLCRKAGISRLLINGSFVTAKEEPNDVDCIALQGPGYRAFSPEAAELRQGLPFIELKVVNELDYERFRDVLFASDRDMIAKGVRRGAALSIQNDQQSSNTERKLSMLREWIAEAKSRSTSPENAESLRSLVQMANQLHEEIVRYHSRQKRRAS